VDQHDRGKGAFIGQKEGSRRQDEGGNREGCYANGGDGDRSD
jgi:hypothetical protein